MTTSRTTTTITLSERAWQAQVLDLARLFGWQIYHTWTAVHSAAGYPDLTLVRPPRLLFVELKSQRGRVTPAQAAWLTLLRACPGVECYLWRPADFEQVAATLRGSGSGGPGGAAAPAPVASSCHCRAV